MNPNRFPMEDYLARIGVPASSATTLERLTEVVEAQLKTIAFENIDLLAARPVRLELGAIVDKLLHHRRGGHCCELNGLLMAALGAAGFTVAPALARVTYRRSEPGPWTHLALLVECENDLSLVDAGFGGPGLMEPMRFEAGCEVERRDARFRLVAAADDELHLQRWMEGDWQGLYRVSPRPVLPVDIEVVNHFISTWERSPFRNRLMCVRTFSDRLVMIQGTDLVVFDMSMAISERRGLRSAHELQATLNSEFDVELPDDLASQAWFAATSGQSGMG